METTPSASPVKSLVKVPQGGRVKRLKGSFGSHLDLCRAFQKGNSSFKKGMSQEGVKMEDIICVNNDSLINGLLCV